MNRVIMLVTVFLLSTLALPPSYAWSGEIEVDTQNQEAIAREFEVFVTQLMGQLGGTSDFKNVTASISKCVFHPRMGDKGVGAMEFQHIDRIEEQDPKYPRYERGSSKHQLYFRSPEVRSQSGLLYPAGITRLVRGTSYERGVLVDTYRFESYFPVQSDAYEFSLEAGTGLLVSMKYFAFYKLFGKADLSYRGLSESLEWSCAGKGSRKQD